MKVYGHRVNSRPITTLLVNPNRYLVKERMILPPKPCPFHIPYSLILGIFPFRLTGAVTISFSLFSLHFLRSLFG